MTNNRGREITSDSATVKMPNPTAINISLLNRFMPVPLWCLFPFQELSPETHYSPSSIVLCLCTSLFVLQLLAQTSSIDSPSTQRRLPGRSRQNPARQNFQLIERSPLFPVRHKFESAD